MAIFNYFNKCCILQFEFPHFLEINQTTHLKTIIVTNYFSVENNIPKQKKGQRESEWILIQAYLLL